ncbi:MAG: TolC family protein, partial [Bacteroidales bacterium]|nr:TolC family protein [Bacteroidales bacterium]
MKLKNTYYYISLHSKKWIGVMAGLLFSFSIVLSQDTILSTWTLEDCVNHAIENNLYLKQLNNNYRKTELIFHQSQMALAPSISFNNTNTTNFEKGSDNSNVIKSSFTLSGSVDLFRGLTKVNSISANKYAMHAYNEFTEMQKQRLVLDIIDLYFAVIYFEKLIDISKEKVKYNEKEKERITVLLDLGRIEPAAKDEIEAAVASAKLVLEQAKNGYQL